MSKHLIALAVAVALVASAGLVHADGGKGPGGDNGKGKDDGKKAAVKLEGMVTALTENADGTTTVTIATGPLTTATVIVNAATKVEVNERDASIADVDVGDFVEVEATAKGIATKLEAEDLP